MEQEPKEPTPSSVETKPKSVEDIRRNRIRHLTEQSIQRQQRLALSKKRFNR